jgi:hypothetical protein
MTQPLNERLHRHAGRVCGIPGCLRTVRRVGSLCGHHDTNVRDRGHHTALSVTAHELKPWTCQAAAFVRRQYEVGHPGIVQACDWLKREAANAQAPVSLNASSSAWVRWQAWLDRLHRDATDPQQVIAVAVACHWHRLEFPERWPDARFFSHQLGNHVIRIGNRVRVRNGKPATRSQRKPSRLLLFAAAELERVIGPLLVRAAHHLHQRDARTHHPVSEQALRAPFAGAVLIET